MMTTAISSTPATWAGTAVISTVEGYAAAPPGMQIFALAEDKLPSGGELDKTADPGLKTRPRTGNAIELSCLFTPDDDFTPVAGCSCGVCPQLAAR